MARHVNIPIFIPHEGCKNECVFCNQKTITGVSEQCDSNVKAIIDRALSTIEEDADTEIAFFGGSFTGIGIDRMTNLCNIAYDYVKQGKVNSVRLSTRPDYIDEEILTILKDKGVTHIELGIQSMKQNVLDSCKRGHTVQDTERACKLINDFGFILGGQMMVGLPCSSLEDELFTAQQIANLGCKESRIYPCVVFHKTKLCEMAKSGEYIPLTVDEAVERSAKVYRILKENNIKVLRIGLQASENLSDENEVYAGANHPALGELVLSKVNLYKILDRISYFKSIPNADYKGKSLIIECNKSDFSKVTGHKKSNYEIIRKAACDTGFSDIKIIENTNVKADELNIHF